MRDFSIQSFKSTTPYPKPLNELVFRSADSFQPANPVEALKLKEMARGKRKERQFMMKLHRQYELDNMKRLGKLDTFVNLFIEIFLMISFSCCP